MRILIAPDSFKESLSAEDVCNALEKGIVAVMPECTILKNPVSDGGEGILPLLVAANHGVIKKVTVQGPLGESVTARYGLIDENRTAVIEMAEAAGLMLVPENKRNPLTATTYGVGELITAAMNQGVETIIAGLGGSATNDGGTGMLKALGYRFIDGTNHEIRNGNEGLSDLVNIDTSQVDQRVQHTKFIVASDVTNPLTGPMGATYTFAAQKGGSPDGLRIMEENMLQYQKMITETKGIDVNTIPGSGAAGGLGAAFVAFLDAEIQSGFELVSRMTGLEEKIKAADVVITGEGKLDKQTLMGKAPAGVANMAKKYGKFLIGVGGIIDREARSQLEKTFDLILPISRKSISKAESISQASELLMETGAYIAVIIEKDGYVR